MVDLGVDLGVDLRLEDLGVDLRLVDLGEDLGVDLTEDLTEDSLIWTVSLMISSQETEGAATVGNQCHSHSHSHRNLLQDLRARTPLPTKRTPKLESQRRPQELTASAKESQFRSQPLAAPTSTAPPSERCSSTPRNV